MITAFLVIADGATQSHLVSEITGLNINEIQGSLTVHGNVNVGGQGNAVLNVRHLDGKSHENANPDHLFLQHGTQKDVYIGGTQSSSLFVKGNVVVGHDQNGVLTVRHINGKSHLNNNPDHLYLNWNNNKDVYVGGETNSNLIVKGKITAQNLELTDLLKITRQGDQIVLESAAPQIKFIDNHHGSLGQDDYWIHVNDNRMYFLWDKNDNGNWDGDPYPLYLDRGNAVFGGNVHVAGTVTSACPNSASKSAGICYKCVGPGFTDRGARCTNIGMHTCFVQELNALRRAGVGFPACAGSHGGHAWTEEPIIGFNEPNQGNLGSATAWIWRHDYSLHIGSARLPEPWPLYCCS